ncbi:MAG TPA: GNAT family N-acetyltransferase [Acidimicrobiales bacterium]
MTDHVLTEGDLELRPLELVDAAQWLAGEDDEQIRWFEAAGPAELSDVEAFIRRCRESWKTMGDHRYWAIRRIDSPEIVGGIDLRKLDNDAVNVSYVVFPKYRHQGIAFRASAMVLNYAGVEMGAKVAVFKMLPENVRSRSVAIRLGAEFSGEVPSNGGATFQVFKLGILRGK